MTLLWRGWSYSAGLGLKKSKSMGCSCNCPNFFWFFYWFYTFLLLFPILKNSSWLTVDWFLGVFTLWKRWCNLNCSYLSFCSAFFPELKLTFSQILLNLSKLLFIFYSNIELRRLLTSTSVNYSSIISFSSLEITEAGLAALNSSTVIRS